MAILNQSNLYTSGESVTAANLNALIGQATFSTNNGEAVDGSTLQVHSTAGYLMVKDGGITSTKLAAGAVDSAIGAGGITDTQLASDAVTTIKIADNAITSAKISDTDTQFLVDDTSAQKKVVINEAGADVDFRVEGDTDANLLVCDATNDTIGIGGAPGSTFKLNVDSGSGKDTIYAKGDQSSAYVDLNLENENSGGLGARVQVIQGINKATFQYQENGERATMNILDGSLSANAGVTIACTSATKGTFLPSGSMFSSNNSRIDLGAATNTWDNAYVNGGAWTGSDINLKQDIEDLDEAELNVAKSLKRLIKKFRLKESVFQKGDNARIHFGVIAQEVKSAFETEGLDPFKYALIGEDTWWEKQNESGVYDFKHEETEGYTKKTKMSVRYEQLLAFIITAL